MAGRNVNVSIFSMVDKDIAKDLKESGTIVFEPRVTGESQGDKGILSLQSEIKDKILCCESRVFKKEKLLYILSWNINILDEVKRNGDHCFKYAVTVDSFEIFETPEGEKERLKKERKKKK